MKNLHYLFNVVSLCILLNFYTFSHAKPFFDSNPTEKPNSSSSDKNPYYSSIIDNTIKLDSIFDKNSQCHRFTVSMVNPLNKDSLKLGFRNNVPWGKNNDKSGIFLHGDVELNKLENLNTYYDFSAQDLESLIYMSRLEANLDGLNTYENSAIISFSWLQFVASSEHGSSLTFILSKIKEKYPIVFEEHFTKYGLDVIVKNNQPEFRFFNPYNYRIYYGDEAYLELRKNKELLLLGLVRNAYIPEVQEVLINEGINMYATPALTYSIKLDNYNMDVDLGTIFSSDEGRGALMALFINHGNDIEGIYRSTLSYVIQEYNIANMKELICFPEDVILTELKNQNANIKNVEKIIDHALKMNK